MPARDHRLHVRDRRSTRSRSTTRTTSTTSTRPRGACSWHRVLRRERVVLQQRVRRRDRLLLLPVVFNNEKRSRFHTQLFQKETYADGSPSKQIVVRGGAEVSMMFYLLIHTRTHTNSTHALFHQVSRVTLHASSARFRGVKSERSRRHPRCLKQGRTSRPVVPSNEIWGELF